MKEIWKNIIYKNTEYISISNLGNVKRNEKLLNQHENHDGYLCVSLKTDNIKNPWRSVQVGILVGLAFLSKPNDYEKFEINHKDYNRKNNNLNNLEWITHADNVRYSICNKPDIKGKNNPNYGNKILSKRYKEDKELSIKKQSRKGLKNGRCKKIYLYKNKELIKEFPYIELCCKYFVNNNLCKCKNFESVRARIRISILKDKEYYGYTIYF